MKVLRVMKKTKKKRENSFQMLGSKELDKR